MNRMGVNLLVDTGSACNLVPTCLCNKLSVAIYPQEQTMVGFSGDKEVTVGHAWKETKVSEWK